MKLGWLQTPTTGQLIQCSCHLWTSTNWYLLTLLLVYPQLINLSFIINSAPYVPWAMARRYTSSWSCPGTPPWFCRSAGCPSRNQCHHLKRQIHDLLLTKVFKSLLWFEFLLENLPFSKSISKSVYTCDILIGMRIDWQFFSMTIVAEKE